MIQKIRFSKWMRPIATFLLLNVFFQVISPTVTFALTGGPAQPEFSGFQPIGVNDMVDLSSGDFSYNLPLLDVGGYPVNMSYNASVGMDDEASWTGLGWNLSIGQINRNVRGLPDDFKGDEITYENTMKANITVGGSFQFTPSIAGFDDLGVNVGVSAKYNNYSGFSISPSVGVDYDLSDNASVGFNVTSSEDGLSVSPSVSIHQEQANKQTKRNNLGANFGLAFNSRRGLQSLSMNVKNSTLAFDKKTGIRTGKERHQGTGSVGSSISFTDNVYTPTKRVPMNTEVFTVNAAIGSEFFTGEGQGQITAFGNIQTIADKTVVSPGYGYCFTEDAPPAGVLDFNREKDGSFSKSTTHLPVTNYTYDTYSIEGQGVGGSYRPYRSQVGYVFDPYVTDFSESGTLGLEIGVGNAAHYGSSFESTYTTSSSGVWETDNYILNFLVENYGYNPKYEKVFFKTTGELSSDDEWNLFNNVHGYQPVRIPYEGGEFNRYLPAKMTSKHVNGYSESTQAAGTIKRDHRKGRSQDIYNITVEQNKKGVGYGPTTKRSAANPEVSRSPQAKNHHVAEIQVTRNDGARYVYGIAVYNNIKKEVSFSVERGRANTDKSLVSYNPGDNSLSNSIGHKNYNATTTPGYAHTYLLTSILSSDYVDLTNNGPTPDDLGSYTKFEYARKSSAYSWRIPFTDASYNAGLNAEEFDDEGNYTYGEKELFYPKYIKTKTHVAQFVVSPRKDARGVLGENGGLDVNKVMYKLDNIRLYSRYDFDQAGFDANGLSLATPIKSVNFEYSYDLCPGVPNNAGGFTPLSELSNQGGKLTLNRVYFTFRNSNMGKHAGYSFTYNNTTVPYNSKGFDSWGKYKQNPIGALTNTSPISTAEFPYTSQNSTVQNANAEAWLLKTIKTPSGGTITVDYESDDYQYVQNRKACGMFRIVGSGSNQNPSNPVQTSSELYRDDNGRTPREYIYVEVPENCGGLTSAQIFSKYFADLPQGGMMFRIFSNVTNVGSSATSTNSLNNADFEYVTGYCQVDANSLTPLQSVNGKHYISFKPTLEYDNGLGYTHPFSEATWNFGRKYIPQVVYGTSASSNETDLESIVSELFGAQTINNLMEIFTSPKKVMRLKGIGRRFIPERSFVRLTMGGKDKLGGGARVKQITITDNWSAMTGSTESSSTYGQIYSYKTESGKSSGVATYEPVGNKENPFVEPIFTTTKHLLAPDEENFEERPYGESFFPSPQVTYSRVVSSTIIPNSSIALSRRTGKIVSEFYTSYDFPTIVDETRPQKDEDKNEVLDNLFNKYRRTGVTFSQGYVIHTNDMNGKPKSTRVYGEGVSTPVSGEDYIYDLNPNGTPKNNGRLNNLVKVILPNGAITNRVMGVEYDVVHDFRENKTETVISGVNANLASFFVGVIPGLVPVPLPDYSESKDLFHSVVTTKVINSYGILRETISYKSGAAVSTKNLAWDAVSGEVLVTEVTDEFHDRYYSLNFPAHWYYGQLGQSAKNSGLISELQSVGSGQFSMSGLGSSAVSDFVMAGDEIVYGTPDPVTGLKPHAWVSWACNSYFTLINWAGTSVTTASGEFEIIHSSRKNTPTAAIQTLTLMRNPLLSWNNTPATYLDPSYLDDGTNWKIISASAVQYSDRWPAECECGISSLSTNPYITNSLGNYRAVATYAYLTGRTSQPDVTPRSQGFLTKFASFYQRTANGSWFINNTDWETVNFVTKYNSSGSEVENRDALNRYSAVLFGYNNLLPMAVGKNTTYAEIGYDGFEDPSICSPETSHFNFPQGSVSPEHSHTGKKSVLVTSSQPIILTKRIACPNP